MSGDDEAYLTTVTLEPHEWMGLQRMGLKGVGFEPVANILGVAEPTAGRLVSIGLAERGPTSCSNNHDGYRLTELGWKVLERGRYPRRSPLRR